MDRLADNRELIATACADHGVARLYVFGSALRDDFRNDDSDIDLLVEFRAMDAFSLGDAYFGLLDELRFILGSDVDLVMVGALRNRYVAAAVDRSKRVLYAA